MSTSKTDILVYAHWKEMPHPKCIGTLSALQAKGKKAMSFAYDDDWLTSTEKRLLDPDLSWYEGPVLASISCTASLMFPQAAYGSVLSKVILYSLVSCVSLWLAVFWDSCMRFGNPIVKRLSRIGLAFTYVAFSLMMFWWWMTFR
jgi:hypothetical protein